MTCSTIGAVESGQYRTDSHISHYCGCVSSHLSSQLIDLALMQGQQLLIPLPQGRAEVQLQLGHAAAHDGLYAPHTARLDLLTQQKCRATAFLVRGRRRKLCSHMAWLTQQSCFGCAFGAYSDDGNRRGVGVFLPYPDCRFCKGSLAGEG